MDAYEIGLALAYPGSLKEAVAAVTETFVALDDAAAASWAGALHGSVTGSKIGRGVSPEVGRRNAGAPALQGHAGGPPSVIETGSGQAGSLSAGEGRPVAPRPVADRSGIAASTRGVSGARDEQLSAAANSMPELLSGQERLAVAPMVEPGGSEAVARGEAGEVTARIRGAVRPADVDGAELGRGTAVRGIDDGRAARGFDGAAIEAEGSVAPDAALAEVALPEVTSTLAEMRSELGAAAISVAAMDMDRERVVDAGSGPVGRHGPVGGSRGARGIEALQKADAPLVSRSTRVAVGGPSGIARSDEPSMGGGGLLSGETASPGQEGGGGNERLAPTIELDGRVIGQWLSEQMGRQAARPSAGTTFFDPRQSPAWTPSGSL